MGKLYHANIQAWAIDFVKAFKMRAWFYRKIALWAMGKFARQELRGLYSALEDAGFWPSLPYELQGCEYHNEHIDAKL